MQRKIFKFKIISKEGHCTLSLDYTNLTNEIIRPITARLIKIEPNEKCKLLFVGKEDCRLTLEDVYNLSSLFQSVIEPVPIGYRLCFGMGYYRGLSAYGRQPRIGRLPDY